MDVQKDFADLCSVLNESKVEILVAVTRPHFTAPHGQMRPSHV